jgi:hypothetical protein
MDLCTFCTDRSLAAKGGRYRGPRRLLTLDPKQLLLPAGDARYRDRRFGGFAARPPDANPRTVIVRFAGLTAFALCLGATPIFLLGWCSSWPESS